MLTCSKFLTTSDYAPGLRARLEVEQQLIDDATAAAGSAKSSDTKQPSDAWSQLLYDLA